MGALPVDDETRREVGHVQEGRQQTISPDGRWRWDGRQWVPVEPPPLQAQAAMPVAQVAAGLACQFCGGQPAIRITLRQHIGALIIMIFRRWRIVCCRDCGIALFRQKQNETLMTGW